MAMPQTVEVTLNLPLDIVEIIDDAAEVSRQGRETVVAGAVLATLPSRKRIDEKVQRLLRSMEGLPEKELTAKRDARLTPAKQMRLSWLLAENGERELTEAEERTLDRLMEEVHKLSLEKGAAILMLRSRAKGLRNRK